MGGQAPLLSQTVNYTLGGKRLDILLNATLLPGHEATWNRVLLSIETSSRCCCPEPTSAAPIR